ncbi:MAG: tetratricopeptide repeat protein [Candidatus Odinarchaeota archaeon]
MPDSNVITQDLLQAESFLEADRYKESLDILEKLEKKLSQKSGDLPNLLVLKSKVLNKLGNYEKAFQIAKQVLERVPASTKGYARVDAVLAIITSLRYLERYEEGFEMIKLGKHELSLLGEDDSIEKKKRNSSLLSTLAGLHFKKGDLDSALELYQQSIAIIENTDDKGSLATIYGNIGIVYDEKGDLKLALDFKQRALALYEKSGNRRKISWLLNSIGNIYRDKGELEQALDHYSRSLAIEEELGNKKYIGIAIGNIAIIHAEKGDLDKALEYFQKNLAVNQEIGNKRGVATCLGNIGLIHFRKGDSDKALTFYYESLAIYEETGDKIGIIYSLSYIGDVHLYRGDLDRALEYFQQVLKLSRESGKKSMIAVSLEDTGRIFFRKGDSNQALTYLQQSLAMKKEMGHEFSETLYHLITVTTDIKKIEDAEGYYQQLVKSEKVMNSKVVNQRSRIARAILLKTSPRARHRGKAEELLEEVVNEEVIFHDHLVDALLHLCDLLVADLRMTGDLEIINELQKYVKKLADIAEGQHSHWLLAESFLIRSKLAILEMNYKEAKIHLVHARDIAEERGLQRLAYILGTELKQTEKEMERLDGQVPQQIPISERLNRSNLEELLLLVRQGRITAIFDILNSEPEQLEQVQIGIGMGSFTDQGMVVHGKSDHCPFGIQQLRSMMEYGAVMYRHGELKTLYGPFPQKNQKSTGQKDWLFFVFGFKIKDEHVQDKRIRLANGETFAIMLICYPEYIDTLFSLRKSKIQDAIIHFLEKEAKLLDSTTIELTKIEKELRETVFSL